MKASDIETFLELIGAKRVRASEPEYTMECPLARWTHEDGEDRHPSMGIKAVEGGASPFNCFTCGHKGRNLRTMVRKLEWFGKKSLPELMEFVELNERMGPGSVAAPSVTDPELEEEILSGYRKAVPNYILNRGVYFDTAKEWGIRIAESDGRVVFPVRDESGKLVGAEGRLLKPSKTRPRYKGLLGLKKRLHFYGEWKLEGKPKIVLVEGLMDVLKLWQWKLPEFDILGLMGSSLTVQKEQKLVEWGCPVVLFLDNDGPGKEAAGRIGKALYRRIPVEEAAYLYPRKDPAECSMEEAREILEKAHFFRPEVLTF